MAKCKWNDGLIGVKWEKKRKKQIHIGKLKIPEVKECYN